jgi:hypothetical protein
MEYKDYPCPLGAIQQRLVHDARVLDAMARIRPGILGLGVFDSRQDHVDFAIAIGVRGDLKACIVHGLEGRIEILLRPRRRNPVIAGLV